MLRDFSKFGTINSVGIPKIGNTTSSRVRVGEVHNGAIVDGKRNKRNAIGYDGKEVLSHTSDRDQFEAVKSASVPRVSKIIELDSSA